MSLPELALSCELAGDAAPTLGPEPAASPSVTPTSCLTPGSAGPSPLESQFPIFKLHPLFLTLPSVHLLLPPFPLLPPTQGCAEDGTVGTGQSKEPRTIVVLRQRRRRVLLAPCPQEVDTG